MKTAILIDGAFYLKRAKLCLGEKSPESRADELYKYAKRHLYSHKKCVHELYRIFYYDCPPMKNTVYHPLNQQNSNFSKSETMIWRKKFQDELKVKRKIALRFGRVDEEHAGFILKPEVTKKLFNGKLTLDKIEAKDFNFTAQQKGVDMKIGLDIASMAYKKQVDRIVLISGDSDFVPAAKLARREGIDFILDPLGQHIKDELSEHIDGLRTCDYRFRMR